MEGRGLGDVLPRKKSICTAVFHLIKVDLTVKSLLEYINPILFRFPLAIQSATISDVSPIYLRMFKNNLLNILYK